MMQYGGHPSQYAGLEVVPLLFISHDAIGSFSFSFLSTDLKKIRDAPFLNCQIHYLVVFFIFLICLKIPSVFFLKLLCLSFIVALDDHITCSCVTLSQNLFPQRRPKPSFEMAVPPSITCSILASSFLGMPIPHYPIDNNFMLPHVILVSRFLICLFVYLTHFSKSCLTEVRLLLTCALIFQFVKQDLYAGLWSVLHFPMLSPPLVGPLLGQSLSV